MAVTLTNKWQQIDFRNQNFTYGSSTLNFTVSFWAYYERISATSGKIHYKLHLKSNSPLNWMSENQFFFCRCGGKGTGEDVVLRDPHGYIYANEEYDVWTSDAAGQNIDAAPDTEYSFGTSYDVAASSDDNFTMTGSIKTPIEYIAPTISVNTAGISSTANSVTLTGRVTSWGVPSDASGRSITFIVYNLNSSSYLSAARVNSISDSPAGSFSITVDNNSTQFGSFSIESNSKYSARVIANNTKKSKESIFSLVSTCPSSPVATDFTIIDPTSASFVLTESSSGSAYNATLKYRIAASGESYGNWVTVSTGKKQTETVTLTGLDSNTNYNIQVKTTTSIGDSEVTTYTNAFKTSEVITTITSQSDVYDSNVKRVITLALSAVSTSSTSYEISYSYKKASDANWTTNVITSPSNTPTITLSNLDQYTTYNFKVKARIAGGIAETWGTEVSANFTTPDYNPGSPIVTYELTNGRKQLSVFVRANQSSASVNRLDGSIKKDNVAIWSGGFDSDEGEVVNLSMPDPREYSTIEISFTQTTSGGTESEPTVVTFPVPRKIIGYIIEEDGTKKAIVGIKTKDKNGNINAGDYEHPFVVK